MEDWKTWACDTSPIALHGAGVSDEIMEMWGHLRNAIIYNLIYFHNQHQARYIDEAQDELAAYARLAEKHFGQHELLTLVLHVLVMHLPDQARWRGPPAFSGESWVERLCGAFKVLTKYRAFRWPECVAVNHLLFDSALHELRLSHQNVTKAFDGCKEKVLSSSAKAVAGRKRRADLRDEPNENKPDYLIGALEDFSKDVTEVRCGCCCMHALAKDGTVRAAQPMMQWKQVVVPCLFCNWSATIMCYVFFTSRSACLGHDDKERHGDRYIHIVPCPPFAKLSCICVCHFQSACLAGQEAAAVHRRHQEGRHKLHYPSCSDQHGAHVSE